METKFEQALAEFCHIAGITPARAFLDIGEASPGACVKKMKNGWVPDDGVLEKLAEYFGVRMDTFKEDGSRADRNQLCYLIGGISGNPNYLQEFETARQYLEGRGYHVCSPAHMTEMLPRHTCSGNISCSLELRCSPSAARQLSCLDMKGTADARWKSHMQRQPA